MASSIEEIERNDPNFTQDLADSIRYVWLAARWLSNLGIPVTVNPTFTRPDARQMRDYSDGGDLHILQRVEVKHRGIEFDSKEAYPYPTVIVDVAHTWDSARPKPYAYIILNQSATACLVIKAESSKFWQRVDKRDTFKQRTRTFYECPIEHAAFFRIKDMPVIGE